MRRSSSLLTRLALGLLAVTGFAAPLPVRQVDPVAQTCGAGPSTPEVLRAPARPRLAVLFPAAPTLETAPPAPRAPEPLRRYLLHRAWLI